jgi:hypothetical protein
MSNLIGVCASAFFVGALALLLAAKAALPRWLKTAHPGRPWKPQGSRTAAIFGMMGETGRCPLRSAIALVL